MPKTQNICVSHAAQRLLRPDAFATRCFAFGFCPSTLASRRPKSTRCPPGRRRRPNHASSMSAKLPEPRTSARKPPFVHAVRQLDHRRQAPSRKLDRPSASRWTTPAICSSPTPAPTRSAYLDLARKKWLRWKAAGKQRFESPVAAVHHGQTFFVADSALGKVLAFDEKGKAAV